MVKKFSNILLATKMLKTIQRFMYISPKISAYRRDFDESKYISLLTKDDESSGKNNEIREKIQSSLKK